MILGIPPSPGLVKFFSSPAIATDCNQLQSNCNQLQSDCNTTAPDIGFFSRPPFAHQARAWEETERLFEKYNAAYWQAGIGVGKTFMAINLARMMFRDRKIGIAVIVAPKTLLDTWIMQIEEHCLEPYSLVKWDAVKVNTKKWKYDFSDTMQVDSLRLVLINIEAFSVMNKTLESVLKEIFKRPTLIVLDESSTIKTHNSNRTKNLTKAAANAEYRIAMSGTAITKSPLDVYGQVEYLKKGFFGESHFMFKQRYAVMIQEYGAGGRKHDKIVGYRNLDELIAKVDSISFKVKTEDCIDLPEKTYETIPIELGHKTRKMYNELRDTLIMRLQNGEYLSTPEKIAQFSKLRQIVGGFVLDADGEAHATGDTDKLDALVDLVADTDDQVVIFASHRAEIKAISERLGDDCVTFYGDTKDKESALKAFQSGKKRFFVGHPQSGGMGLNLQNSHIMIFYSIITRDFQQIIGRIHRSGQTIPCIYYFLVAIDTIDKRLMEIVTRDEAMLSAFESGDSETLIKILQNN
jgi:SNF2 family DNA or RNA helicase